MISGMDLKGEKNQGTLNRVIPTPYCNGKNILFQLYNSSRYDFGNNCPLKKARRKTILSLAFDTIPPSAYTELMAL